MQVFKFGGASVKDAKGVQNIITVLQKTSFNNVLIVVSAMGKTTNALENVVNYYFYNPEKLNTAIQEVIDYHITIIDELFGDKKHGIYNKFTCFIEKLNAFLKNNTSKDYNFIYDQIVSYGELISTTIINQYLLENNINNQWIDARTIIKTDNNYRNATVNWEETKKRITTNLNTNTLNITQGFLASDEQNHTTTLGREGSDYTAAIFAYCLEAKSVTIWKDVPGVLNADPRYFNDTQLLHQISYEEAIELAFYGASVIHPKTLQPLKRKGIPLHVKSFINPEGKGTCVSEGHLLKPLIPCFIVKKKQILISLSSSDFSFIVEKNISQIFELLHKHKLKVDVIQNSAISFSVCVDDKFDNFTQVLPILQKQFKVTYNQNVALYTIRHHTDEAVSELITNKKILLKQENRATIQLVVSE